MKKLLALILSLILISGSLGCLSVSAASTKTVNVDGTPIEMVAYNIDGNNYFKLRDIANILSGTQAQFDVTWNQSASAVEIVTGVPYSTREELTKEAVPNPTMVISKAPIYKDGKRIFMSAYNIGGNNFFKLRDLAAEIDFGVFWSQDTGIRLDTTRGYALTLEEEKALYIEYAKRRHAEFIEQNAGWGEEENYYNFGDVDRDGKAELLVKKGAGITIYKAVGGEVKRMFCDPLPESSGVYQYHYVTYQGKDYIAYVNGGSEEFIGLYILEGDSLVMLKESKMIAGANEWYIDNVGVTEAEYNAHKAAIDYPERMYLEEIK